MKPLRKFLDRVKPHFEPGGKLQAFRSVFDGMETFLYTPRSTSRSGVHIHDSIDSKRTMIIVVMALFLWFTDKTLEWVLYDLILGWRK